MQGSLLDDVMLIGFAGPASATGEDVLEIHTHGSPAVVEDILHHLAVSPAAVPLRPANSPAARWITAKQI